MRYNYLYMDPWSADKKEKTRTENLSIYACQAIPG